jgi:hypothetical protein
MAAPIVAALAIAISRAIASQAVKQGVKQLPQAQARRVAKQVIAKQRSTRSLSGKDLDRVINRVNNSARSTKPVKPKGGPVQTTTGSTRKKVSDVSAKRMAEESAGPKARSISGNPNRASSSGAIRATAPKPDVRITTKAGKYRGYGSLSKEKVTVTRPVKRLTNKDGSAITIRRKPPMSKKEIAKAQIEKNAAAKAARTIEGGVGKRPARPGGAKMSEEKRIKNRGLAVVSRGRGATKTPSLDDYKYQSGGTPERSRPTIETRSSQNPESRGRNVERASKPFDENMAEAERRVNAGMRNRTGGEYDLGKGKKPDLPNSKAIAETARKRPGIRKRKEAAVNESRARANAAMNKRGMTPEQKKAAVMKARAKARKIARNTGGL